MSTRQALLGPLLTLALIAITEVVGHGFEQSQVAVTFFLLALAPAAYAGLRAGLWNSIICSILLSLYGLHYVAPHEELVRLDGPGLSAALILLILGLGMGWPMSRVGAREARLSAELQSRAKALEERNAELLVANASLEAFGSVVSHDLKEPVRALENYLDAARQTWPGEESRRYLDEAYAANRRLTRLLEGLLAYSRTSSLHAEHETVPLGELIASEACMAQYGHKQSERRASVELARDLPAVIGDRGILAQLFGNLILNAIRHHPRDGARVLVRSVGTEGGRAHVVVEDDGDGFPKDVIARFDRLEGGRLATIKTGFGLAIAHRAAARLGGRLWLENRPEGGAAAHVELSTPAVAELRKAPFFPDASDDPPARILGTR